MRESNSVKSRIPCKMALADGTVVTGIVAGATGETGGELCFNTSMTGYQEISSDPSYKGQLMMMTYPHIGNYGVHDDDMEAAEPMIAGLIVRSFCNRYSNQNAGGSLQGYMLRHNLVGISGIDTRTLVRRIRSKGVMNAFISSVNLDNEYLIAKAKGWPSMEGLELASTVSTKEPYSFCDGSRFRIAVLDFGVKLNILRSFKVRDCAVKVFPYDTPVGDIMQWEPNGIFLSNGPGDPRAMRDSVANVKQAIETGLPLFGICLGHQLLALSQNLDVYKMLVGHRGANQPVRNLATGHVEVTTQNHGFAVKPDSIKKSVAEMSHRNLNDDSVEGLRFTKFRGFSVQYHPEASPGPHDSRYLFDDFVNEMAQTSLQTQRQKPSSTTTNSELTLA